MASAPQSRPLVIGTRGSPLALAQANWVAGQCRAAFPGEAFELKIIKTTGDRLQTASLAQPEASLPKGLFTKELELALLDGDVDLAVHSLKDLPTELPAGLELGAVPRRADARDAIVYRDAAALAVGAKGREPVDWSPGDRERRGHKPHATVKGLPAGWVVSTSSTRRRAQILAARGDLSVVEIRGNVGTRLGKLAEDARMDATVLAAAGLGRLGFAITRSGRLVGAGVPEGLLATLLDPADMLPAPGQAALGIETRIGDARLAPICARLNHFNTRQCVVAERSFLSAMGGGCQSPTAAYAEVIGHQLRLRAGAEGAGGWRGTEVRRPVNEAGVAGATAAENLRHKA